jgi:hypothetical protein
MELDFAKVEVMKNKILIILVGFLILVIIIFLSYSILLMEYYPHKIRGVNFNVHIGDEEMEEINLTLIQSKFNNKNLNSRYILSNNTRYEYDIFTITPINNSDIQISFGQRFDNSYFHGDMAYEVRFPGGYGDYGKAAEILRDEVEVFLVTIDLGHLASEIVIGDNDFDQLDDIFFGAVFFFLLSIIIVTVLLILYQKGKLIDAMLYGGSNSLSVLPAFFLLFLGTWALLQMLHNTFVSTSVNVCGAMCYAMSIFFIVGGVYVLRKLDYHNRI